MTVTEPPADRGAATAQQRPPPAPTAAPERVSTLELFFDLVFVFTITQLSAFLAREPTVGGLLRVALMLGLIWWMYGGYAWLTNAVSVERPANRAFLLAAMCGYLILALAIPKAFGAHAMAFALSYLAVVLVHAWLFLHGSGASVAQAFARIAPVNLTTAAMVVLGAAVGGTPQVALWAAAFVVEWASPHVSGNQGFLIAPAHFVERHGLVVIVAIGESVVAIGIGAAGLDVDADLVLVALLGLLLSAALWWTYFGGDDTAAERALRAMPWERRPLACLDAFGYAHLPMLLGIVCVAVGLKKATGHAYDELALEPAAVLGGGAALFLAGDAWFRRVLRIGTGRGRMVGAAAALLTIPLGISAPAVLQLAALVAVVALAAAYRGRSA
jgi:low temperature requirement protein LtrA